MRKLVLVRINETSDRTHGRLMVFDGVTELARYWTLELPWRNNERNISRIPQGRYRVTPEQSAHLGWVLLLHDVPGRDSVLIHSGNLTSQTRGCILCAQALADIDGDGKIDASRSRAAISDLSTKITSDSVLLVVEAI